MKIIQLRIESLNNIDLNIDFTPNIILCFSSLKDTQIRPYLSQLKSTFPNVKIVGCSTGGNIIDTSIHISGVTLTCIQFERSIIDIKLSQLSNENILPIKFCNPLHSKSLKHILVFTDLQSNHFSYINEFQNQLPENIKISGGVAATNSYTKNNDTYVIYNGVTYKNATVFIGLYGENIKVDFGSFAGWDSFGIERIVTRSEGNILYELNGEKALPIYKNYLSTIHEEFPSAAIKFPISVRIKEDQRPIVRTVAGYCEKEQSIEFAGDIPLYSSVKLMKANLDRIIQGAKKSAQQCLSPQHIKPQLALLISCMGRQAILENDIQEEIEVVREVFDENCTITGFYSYGEYAPISNASHGVLHNQTMTITTISE